MPHTVIRTSQNRTEWKNQHSPEEHGNPPDYRLIFVLIWCLQDGQSYLKIFGFTVSGRASNSLLPNTIFKKFSVVHLRNSQQLFRAPTMINSCIQCHGTCLCPAKVILQSSAPFCFVSWEPMPPKRTVLFPAWKQKFLIASRRNNEFKSVCNSQ
jgi:hypothetical protein